MYWNIWQVACWNRPAIFNCDFNRVLELRLLWAVAQCIPCVFVFPKIALSKNNTKNSKQQHHRMFEHYESQIIVAYCGHIFIWCQNLWNYLFMWEFYDPAWPSYDFGYLRYLGIPSAPKTAAWGPICPFTTSSPPSCCKPAPPSRAPRSSRDRPWSMWSSRTDGRFGVMWGEDSSYRICRGYFFSYEATRCLRSGLMHSSHPVTHRFTAKSDPICWP